MNICIIPARGGSKRISKKNIREFHGKPIIAYSIEAAIKANCFQKIIVSTDDQEIAAVAKKWGAEIPFMRPDQISDDFSTTMDVIQHAIEWFENDSCQFDMVCCIYATAPFITSEDILHGLKLLKDQKIQYTFSATSFSFPIQRAFYLNHAGTVSMFQPKETNTRSQDLQEAYHDAGQFYWGKASAFKAGLPLFSKHSKAVNIPKERVQDIDTSKDWEYAEKMYELLEK